MMVRIHTLLVHLLFSSLTCLAQTKVDTYCKYPVPSLKFLSPVLAKDAYTFTVSVMGERGNWSDKRKSDYGSSGCRVSVDKIVLSQ